MNNKQNRRELDILEWPMIESKLSSLCYSEPAKKFVSKLSPLPEHKISMQMKKISAVKDIMILGERADFSGFSDISMPVKIAEKGGMLSMEELFTVRKFTSASERIGKFLSINREEYPVLDDEYSRLNPLPVLMKILQESVTDEGELNMSKFPQLRRIRKDIASARQRMEKSINKIIHSPHNEKTLQEKTFTTVNGRYVILVKSGMKGKINGNVHDVSASGATVLMEPSEITPLNNSIIMMERELALEIEKILTELTISVAAHAMELRSNQRVITYFDFINGAARLSIETGSNEPILSQEPVLKLYQAHHPLLYMMSKETIISNYVELGTDYSCLIISGANTGGKTVMLKTIGLCALFAMMGLHIPAGPDSQIGIFDGIMADIGDDQNLSESLSTFSGQLTIINDIIHRAGTRTLVIIDEIIVGTNPRQGAALSQAILEEMINTGSRIVVTTHYTELKELAVNDTRFQNASVKFNLETLQPTYELAIGIPGISYAVEIAKNYGIEDSILERTRELIDSKESSVESLIEKVQLYEDEVKEEREKVRLLNMEINSEKERLRIKQEELNRLIDQTKMGRGIEFIEELNSYREKLSERITQLQTLDQKEAGSINEEIKNLQGEIGLRLKKNVQNSYKEKLGEMKIENAKKGDRVFIPSIETEATIEEIDGSGKSALLLLGGTIRSRFKLKDLLPISAAKNQTLSNKSRRPAAAVKEVVDHVIATTIQTSSNTIDLRGKRVEDGLSFMDMELDRMDRNNTGTVIVIHGHGTGAMKQAVRDALKMNIYVSDFRQGESGEGGDGVTVVRLRG